MDKKLTEEEQAQLEELQFRRNMAVLCKKIADEVTEDDPLYHLRASAIAEYNRQIANIDKKIEALTGKPPDVVVRLKPGVLFPKAQGIGGQ